MKTFSRLICMFSGLVLCLAAQADATAQSAPLASTVPTLSAKAKRSFRLIDQGAHQRVWEALPASGSNTLATATNSTPRSLGGSRVVEIASGLNYWDGQRWAPSAPAFEIQGNAFVANKAYQQVQLAANLNLVGAVRVSTPDKTTLVSSPVGIGLYDPVSGNSLIIGAITNCQGVLVSTNQVLYESAFSGIAADVVYTIERGSFQQDVVLREAVDPGQYGFSEGARIQLFTEFYGAPEPKIVRRTLRVEKEEAVRQRMASPDLVDARLTFGHSTFGVGRAYLAPGGLTNSLLSAPVAKDFFKTDDGRTILSESVECRAIKAALRALSKLGTRRASATGTPRHSGAAAQAAIPRPNGKGESAMLSAAPSLQLAKDTRAKRPGLVIDYVDTSDINGDAPYVFQSDTTYFVSGPSYFSGTVTIEGGTVFKYPLSTYEAFIEVDGDLTLKTASYRPAVFTAADDDTIGESLAWIYGDYTGNPTGNYYAAPALSLMAPSSVNLSNLRVSYAQTGIEIYDAWITSSISHSQFVNCDTGIVNGFPTYECDIYNCLFAHVNTPLSDDNECDVYWSVRNCTFDQGGGINAGQGFGSIRECAACIFANLGSVSFPWSWCAYYNGFYNTEPAGDPAFVSANYPFQTVGAGGYYLAPDSPFRNACPFGESGLATRTTYPPIVYSNATISADTLFSPQAQRDTAGVDLGYHYDPIDYAFGGCDVSANLTFSPGTVVGWFRTSSGWNHQGHGIHLGGGHTIAFNGKVDAPDYWVRCNVVQEQSNPNWYVGNLGMGGITSWDYYPSAVVQGRFTRCISSAYERSFFADDYGSIEIHLQDCELHGGYMGVYWATIALTNCLLDRSAIVLVGGMQGHYYALRNCTFHGGGVALERWPEDWGDPGTGWVPVTFLDCAFDGTAFSTDDAHAGDGSDWTYYNFNYYLTGGQQPTPPGPNDQTLDSFNWQSGWLGNYYLPSDSPLKDAGSTTADQVGLYHYTTQVAPYDIEGFGQVDIGYHYVGVDENGNPLDDDSDGTPNYLEDANGNGLVDSGETNWQDPLDPGLQVIITHPKNNSLLP